MNKLVVVPSKFNPYLSNFSDLFTKPGFVSFRYLTTAIAVCDNSKTVFSLHDTMANGNGEKKGRSSYSRFITDGHWDEDEKLRGKQIYSLKSLASKKAARYCSSLMIPTS